MIRILITDAAYAALSGGHGPSDEQRHTGAGRYGQAPAGYAAIWLLEAVIEALRAAREPSESYSDVILRIAAP